MKILFIGPQGSGKSTQGKSLAEFLHIPYLSTGDIFRKLSSEQSDESQRIRAILSAGKLVDDQTTCEIVKHELAKEIYKDGFILDGYPRTLEQLNIYNPEFDKVIYLEVSKVELMKRLTARGRSDDTPESINNRLSAYFAQTEPLLAHFQRKNILIKVNGMGSVGQIEHSIKMNFN